MISFPENNRITVSATAGFWIMSALILLYIPLPWIGALFFSGMVHEFCHYLAVKKAGVPITVIRLTARGLYMDTAPMDPLRQIICALSGPLGGLSLLLVSNWLPRTAACGLIQSCYHLLPIFPLDGGRALRGWINYMGFCQGDRICRWVEIAVLILAFGFGWYFMVMFGLWLPMALMLILAFRVFQEKYLAKN